MKFKNLKLKNLRMSAKMGLMTVVILLLPILSLIYISIEIKRGSVQVSENTAAIQEASEVIDHQAQALTRLALTNEAAFTFSQMQYWLVDLSVSLLNESEDNANANQAKLETLFARLETTDPQLVDSLRLKGSKYFETMISAVDAYADDNRVLGNSLIGESRRLAATIEQQLSALLTEVSGITDDASEKIVKTNEAVVNKNLAVIENNDAILRMSMILPVVAVIVGFFVAFFTTRSIVGPVKAMAARAKEIAAGDLTGEALPVRSQDELGSTTASMNEMSTSLQELIVQVTHASREVAGASTQIAASSEEMATGMNDQSSQITQISSAVEEMSASVIEVARKSAEAVHNAEESGKVAAEGLRSSPTKLEN